MKPRTLPPLSAAFGLLAFFAASAAAHPGHDEDPGAANTPAFFLAQAGAPPSGQAAARASGKVENSVSITRDGVFLVIKSNGWPDHAPGAFPRRGNPNTPTAQSYTFRVPLRPQLAETPERRGGWWWGVALNGVPFEPGTGETWNNDPRSGWRYEAATGFLNLGLDEHNAHVQPNGSYHYHALPTGLVERLGGDAKKMLLVGWAADGFPIYTGTAHAEAKDATSALRKMKSSYRLKQGARPAQESGPGGNYDGRFSQDFEFVKDAGDLDECNGRTGVTPEFPEGTYYYCISAEFPFVPRMWRGVPDQSFSKGERPPGGGPGGGLQPAPLGGAPRGILEGGPGPTQNAPAPTGPAAGRGGGPNLPAVIALDLNKDGVIDAEELAKAAASLKTLDKNGDGKLTPDEYRAGPPGGGGPGGGGGPPPQGAGGPAGAAVAPAPVPTVPAPAATNASTKPNILLLIADDLGWGDVAFHQGSALTPNLDRLAKEGTELQRILTGLARRWVRPVGCGDARHVLSPRLVGGVAHLLAGGFF